MSKSVAIIIPTTGSTDVEKAIQSCIDQTYTNIKIYVVVDGKEYFDSASIILDKFDDESVKKYYLSENTGKNGHNGHRIYSAFSFLSSEDYIVYLDQDCWFDSNHIESCINSIVDNDWCYSLRKIVDKSGGYICNDDCESLGKYKPVLNYNLCDTNTYFIKREVAIVVSPYFIGGYSMGKLNVSDRLYYPVLENNFPKFDCTGEYTVNYRLGGTENSVQSGFFEYWNNIVKSKYEQYPWRKNEGINT